MMNVQFSNIKIQSVGLDCEMRHGEGAIYSAEKRSHSLRNLS